MFLGLFGDNLTNADKAKLVLQVEGHSDPFAFSDAGGPSPNGTYFWASTGLDWSSTSEVTLRLRDTPAAPTATLVSNTGESGESTPPSSSPTDRAQAFTTGPNPGGYNLVSVGIVSTDAESSAATVSLCEVDSDNFPT